MKLARAWRAGAVATMALAAALSACGGRLEAPIDAVAPSAFAGASPLAAASPGAAHASAAAEPAAGQPEPPATAAPATGSGPGTTGPEPATAAPATPATRSTPAPSPRPVDEPDFASIERLLAELTDALAADASAPLDERRP